MVFCRCPCHANLVGDLLDAEHRGDLAGIAYYATDDHMRLPPMVAVSDQVESLVASGCSCMTYHLVLRTHRRLPFDPPRPYNPSQADGDE